MRRLFWPVSSLSPRFVGLFLISLAAAFPALAQVSQPAVFNLKKISQTETTQTYEVRVDIFEVGGVCPPGEPYCVQYTATVRITPCPEGLACANGYYEYMYLPFTTLRQVTLKREQEYTFDARITASVGTIGASPCYFRCYFDQDAITKKLTPPPPVPAWEVTFESADQDLLWYSVRLLYADAENDCAVHSSCNSQQDYGVLRPAAFAVTGASTVSQYPDRTVFRAAPNSTVRVALQVGHNYVLSGGHATQGYRNEMSGACVEPNCTNNQIAPEKTIVATPTPTRRVTWGSVKATRRSH